MNQPLLRYVDYMYSYPHKTAYRSFPSPVSLVPYLKQVEGRKHRFISIFPFCSHKCGYCNLFSLQTNRADYIATYLETLTSRRNSCAASPPGWHLIVSPLEEAHRCSSLFLNWNTYWIQLPYSRLHPSARAYFRRNIAGICRSCPFGLVEASRSGSCEYWRTEFP